jgi:DNA primase catalytic core
MKIKNFDEATKLLQSHLVEYLESKGIDTKRNFKCLSPTHSDGTPSMSIVRPDSIRVYCHGCARTGDIFDVCSWIEKKALTGQGFISETLPYLAKTFNIELEHTELTEDEQYQLDTYRVYRHAMEYITAWHINDNESLPVDIETELKRRSWFDKDRSNAIEILQGAGIGFIRDFADFRNHMKGLGFAAAFLDDVDLGRKDIFSPGHLIFTIKDEAGRPVGFAARDLNWIKGEGPKYVNQKTTGVKCNIYQKGKRLYGLDHALKFKNTGPIYIMEGYPDVISCHINNFPLAVATCGTSLTDDHLLLLKEHGIYEIVLCYDNDNAGQERTEALLDSKFCNHKDMSVSILTVPSGKDPDDFIRENGIKAFQALKTLSAFQWRLHRFDETVEQEVICKKMIPFIVSEPSHISQEKMIQELAKFTGFNVKTLSAELQRLVNDKEKTKARERNLIIDKMHKDISASPDEAELILSETQTKLYGLKVKYDEDSMSENSTLKFLQDVKSREEVHDGKQLGFFLGEDLREYQNALLGEWKDTMQVFGGKANSGKTSFLVKLGYEIARHEAQNNALVIYHTIDDSAEQLLPKFITVAEGSTQLEINHVKNPNYWKDKYNDWDGLMFRREQGYQTITRLIRDGRLVIKDATHGTSLAYSESLIKYYSEKYPDRRIVYILDNFHKIRDFEGLDERIKFKTASQQVKFLAVKHHITILCTMEYTKLAAGIKPTNDNIAETVQMEYDANLIAHLWNGMHELGDRATIDMFHTTLGPNGPERKPIVEISIGKNKMNSFKSKLYLKFFPAAADFKEQPLDVALALQAEANERNKDTRRSKANHAGINNIFDG